MCDLFKLPRLACLIFDRCGICLIVQMRPNSIKEFSFSITKHRTKTLATLATRSSLHHIPTWRMIQWSLLYTDQSARYLYRCVSVHLTTWIPMYCPYFPFQAHNHTLLSGGKIILATELHMQCTLIGYGDGVIFSRQPLLRKCIPRLI